MSGLLPYAVISFDVLSEHLQLCDRVKPTALRNVQSSGLFRQQYAE